MKAAAAAGALALGVVGCLEPDSWSWPQREGLAAVLVTSDLTPDRLVRVAPATGAATLALRRGDFRAYGYRYDPQSLQIPEDRAFTAEGEACGRVGRALPPAEWVFGPGEGAGPLAELNEDPPRLLGPIFDAAACRRAGGAIHEVEESTLCLPAAPLQEPPAPASPASAAWPTGCTDLSDCAVDPPPCAGGQYRLSRRGGCEALAACDEDAWPAEVTHWVDPMARQGNGSLASPFAQISEAVAAGAVVIGLLPGEHVTATPLGGLTLIGVCAERTTLRLEAGILLRRPARWTRMTIKVAPQISTGITVDGRTLQLEAVALVGTSSRAIRVANGGRLEVRRAAISGFLEQVTVETSTAVLQQIALLDFSATGLTGRAGSSVSVDGARVVAGPALNPQNVSIYSQNSRLTVHDLRVAGFAASGLLVDGGGLRANDVEVSGPARSGARSGGILLRCPGPEGHRLERGLVRRASHLGFEVASLVGDQPCPEGGGPTELSDLRSTETVATRDNQYDASGLRVSGVAEVRVQRFESIADPRGLTFGEFVAAGVVTDVVVRDPAPPDRTERGAVRAVCPGCRLFIERMRIVGAPTGLSVGPGIVVARDVEVQGGAIGFIIGEDLGATTDATLSLSRSVGTVTGFLFRRGRSALDQISTVEAQVGLQLAGALSSNSDVTRFRLQADEPLYSMVPGFVVRLEQGLLIGPGADAGAACANGQGWRLRSVATSP